jgi:radical SAM superfamily enzyme YgiQ (UPF0313 family)
MSKVLLIYPGPDEVKNWRFGFSLNLLYLSSILKQANHQVTNYLDYSLEKYDMGKLYYNVSLSDIIIVEFDSFPLKRTVNIAHGQELIEHIKTEFPEKKIIVFGHDIALFPRQLKKADFTLSMEPEKNILKVIDITTGKETNVAEFKPEYLENLDELPFPDRSLLTPFAEQGGSIVTKPNLARSTLVETSRGCLNSCVFCQRKGWANDFRTHSVEYVVKEFAEIEKKNYKNIWISDDNFTYDLKRAKVILRNLTDSKITREMKIALSSWANIDQEFLELAVEANISIISFGIESANEEILKFYKKSIDPEKFKKLLVFADEIGLYTVGNFIFGAPKESEETIEKTFNYIIDTPFDQVNLKILDYMAGSELYNKLPPGLKKSGQRHVFACKENGLNRFPLRYLEEKLARFRKEFSNSRKKRLRVKIKSFGPPYFVPGTFRHFD